MQRDLSAIAELLVKIWHCTEYVPFDFDDSSRLHSI